MGVRQPLHDVHRLPAPRLRALPGPGLLLPDEPGADQPVLRPQPHPRRGPRADRGAVERDRHRSRAEPRGEGDQPDRAAALRGVRQGLHRQAVADRPQGAEPRHHQPAPGPLHLRQPLLQRHLRRSAHRRLHRVADPDGRSPEDRGPARHRLLRRGRRLPGPGPDRLHRPRRRVLRQQRGPAVVAHRRPRARGPGGRRLPGHARGQLQRPGGALHPDPGVQALPPRAHLPARQDRDRARVQPLRRGGRRAVLPDQHRRRPSHAQEVPRPGEERADGPLRSPPRHLPVPRHAHGHRLGPQHVRQQAAAALHRRCRAGQRRSGRMTTTATTTAVTVDQAAPKVRRLLQRQILPIDRDTDVFALYVDPEEARLDADRYEIGGNRAAKDLNNAAIRQSTSTGRAVHPDQIESRTAFRLRQGDKMSFGTYFNAFPASYWRRWSVVDDVRLSVTVAGRGASVTVYKSMANGRSQRVDAATVEGDRETFDFDLTLTPFVDGGWYWYDVVAGDEDAVVESAEWTADVPADRAQHGTADIVITTMNRPDFCAKLLTQIGEDDQLRPYLDTVFLSEQGSKKVADSEFFPAAQKSLGDLLRINEQGNLGGSGGYARGQLESVRKGTATYALMMDDDVVCEPEGIIRAVTFGDLAKRPTIVGGHMFNIYQRSQLHSFGEVVQPWRFWWKTREDGFSEWDFAARNLRSAPRR